MPHLHAQFQNSQIFLFPTDCTYHNACVKSLRPTGTSLSQPRARRGSRREPAAALGHVPAQKISLTEAALMPPQMSPISSPIPLQNADANAGRLRNSGLKHSDNAVPSGLTQVLAKHRPRAASLLVRLACDLPWALLPMSRWDDSKICLPGLQPGLSNAAPSGNAVND